ncbi:MAG TPA: TonB-dependent receptor [Blastocatellia bacterium]|nr:TonB-dependent receptor [Blastocatellia bacterium]
MTRLLPTSPTKLSLLVTLLALICSAAFAQQPDASAAGAGRITGRVTDQRGDAVSSGRVTATPTRDKSKGQSPLTTTTDNEGRFVFDAIPSGEYELRVTATGFNSQTRKATVMAATVTADFSLEPASIGDTLTVTPARAELRLSELPASVTVLDSESVGNAAAQTVDDLLRQVPGFSNFRRSSSIVANPTTQGVSLRGAGASGASRTLVLADGIPLNDAFGGWVYWDRVPREAIDRVELVRGGESDLYGSDALSGVINLITRPPTSRTISAQASYGTRSTGDVSFFASDKFGPLSVALSGEALRTDGYFIIAPEIRGPADEEAGQRHRLLALRLGHEWNAENSVFVRGSLFDEDRKNGTLLQRNDTATQSLAVGGRLRTNDGSYWNLTLFANKELFHQSFTSVSANRATEALIRLQAVPSRDVGLSLNWSRLTGEKHLLVAGVDVRGVRGTSDETVIVNNRATSIVSAGGRQRRIGFFAQDLITITPRWQLTLSARYDNWRDSSAASVTRTLATGAVTPRFFAPRTEDAFSPRLALLYRASEKVSLRAAAYRAFRTPTLNELYRAFRVGDTQTNANENLTSERLTGGEAGVSWTPTGNLVTRLTYYFTETVNPISNFTLSVTPTLITRQRRNLGRTRSQGLEAEADLRVASRWNLSAGYLFADATVRRAPQDASLVGNLIPQVPRHQLTLQAAYSHPQIVTAALQFRASGRQFDDDQNRLPLRSFALIDATVSRPLGRYVDVFVAVQNLLDERYAVGRTPLETIGAPRLFRGGLRLRFEGR